MYFDDVCHQMVCPDINNSLKKNASEYYNLYLNYNSNVWGKYDMVPGYILLTVKTLPYAQQHLRTHYATEFI